MRQRLRGFDLLNAVLDRLFWIVLALGVLTVVFLATN